MVKSINEIRYEKSGVILFNSYSKTETEVLSNLHVCRLEYEGRIFHSSEQLFYWLRLYGYNEYQEELLRCETSKDVKRKGSEYMKKLGVVEDLERDVQLLRLAIRVKYNCCEEFRNFLDNHPNIPIVEYAWWGDTTFGCVDEDAKLKYDWLNGFVKGKNVCGRIIKGVRDEAKDIEGKAIIAIPDCLSAMKPQLLF